MIIWLALYPRSGNTFFRLLLKAAFDQSTFSIYDDKLFDAIGASQEIGHAPLPAPVEELKEKEETYFV